MINEAANVIVQQMNAIEQLLAERDAAYARGLAAGLEQAAGVCDARARETEDALGDWSQGENFEAKQCAAAIRALLAPAGDA